MRYYRAALILVFLAAAVLAAQHQQLHAGGSNTKGDEDGFIKVEAKGKLKTGIVAIGGETTGTILNTGKLGVELDFGSDDKLRKSAEGLDGKIVVVTGTLISKMGVTTKKTRLIVQVKTLKAAN